jgi:PKD repeat protein
MGAPALAMTPAGTVISSVTTCTYDGGSVSSNPVDVIVSQIGGCQATPESGTQTGDAGGTVYVPVLVTNTGNGSDTFCLSTSSVAGWPVLIYRDDNGDGLHQAGETTIVADTGLLAMGEDAALVLAASLPSGVTGSDSATLTVHSNYDTQCIATATFAIACISVSAGDLAASFSASPRKGTSPLSASFTDQSSGGPVGWVWHFGDGSGSFQQSPVHTYVLPGIYSVSLVVTDGTTTSEKGWSRCVTVSKARSTSYLFSDVPPDHWAYGGVMACYDVGLIAGYPDGTYRPTLSVSRDQMAVYVSRALAGNDQNVPRGPVEASFADVPASYWAYRYVEYARTQRIVLGFPDGLFHPTEEVNRGQMAVFLARLLAEPAGDAGLTDYVPPETPWFSDVGPSGEWSWCYKYVEYLRQQHVVEGYPDGSYRPDEALTRDQMAVYIARAFALP